MSYNAPAGADLDSRCPWWDIRVSVPRSKCIFCGEYHDDDECEVHHGLVFCKECVEAINEHGDGIEEEVKHLRQ